MLKFALLALILFWLAYLPNQVSQCLTPLFSIKLPASPAMPPEYDHIPPFREEPYFDLANPSGDISQPIPT